MNRIQFGEGACEKTRKYIDSYISNELLIETNHEVLRHIESCPSCSAEVEAKTQLRNRLRSAVKSQAVPPELQVHIRERISKPRSHSWMAADWTRWAVAAAATILDCAGVWSTWSRERLPGITDRPAQTAYIQKISASMAAVLKVGLGDHIHCAVFRKYPKTPPTVDVMEEKLGPEFKGLLPVVRASVPDGYRIVMAHQCTYGDRKFVHFTMEKNGTLLSLVIARKQPGDSLQGLSASGDPAGIPIFQSSAQKYEVAGFDAGNFLAYVVSDLKSSTNLQVAENLAPGVHRFLMNTPV
jgi:anti-sigma factor (TIGR02949 family)